MSKKIIEVDWDDQKSLNKIIQMLHIRKREISDYKSKSERANDRRSLYLAIWAKNIEIKDLNKSLERDFYVYVHHYGASEGWPGKKSAKYMFLDRLGINGDPFYVGKGCKDRAFNKKRNIIHQKWSNNISKTNGKDYLVTIVKENLTELESLIYEGKLIDILGQRTSKTGNLTNIDEGYKYKQRRKFYSEELCLLCPSK